MKLRICKGRCINLLNNIIIETFKDNCNGIYKLNEEWTEYPTYLLVVDDVYSETATDCYDLYYILLGKIENYFEIKIVNKNELENIECMKIKKITK